jgi:uncharacterized protein YbbC (DUF1343 family)
MKRHLYFTCFLIIALCFVVSCQLDKGKAQTLILNSDHAELHQMALIVPGAENLNLYLPGLKNKKVALVVNQTSIVGSTHLLDTLLALEIDVSKVFTPEHGFKGTADAGQKVNDHLIQRKKQLPVISLYGDKRSLGEDDLIDVDVVVFDIQDVGVRFYTYISTLHYVMEACAENDVPLIVLDRPNPNGHYVDGPVLEPDYRSFVGMHTIPVVYGMTIGELALMLNGEAMLKNGVSCELSVVKNSNYTHLKHYSLPVNPSPNLPDDLSVLLYPSLCFFEGTPISVGRGTDRPFTKFGHPSFIHLSYSFTPQPNTGASKPKLLGQECFGVDLAQLSLDNLRGQGRLNLGWLLECYKNWQLEEPFFNPNGFFDKLAGTSKLREQIQQGYSEETIRQSWKEDIEEFKATRKKYLLYPDFE